MSIGSDTLVDGTHRGSLSLFLTFFLTFDSNDNNSYRLVDGIAESSYGTQVAALAGVPHEICDRAAAVSKQFAEATKASQAEKNKSAIPLALLSDFVHLFKLAGEQAPASSDRSAEAKALTTLSQLDIIRSQVAALADGSSSAITAPKSASSAPSAPTSTCT